MFGRKDNSTTIHPQHTDNNDIDEEIEIKIKACQRENGRCMTSTSRRLRQKFGDEKVNRVLSRLNRRRERGNQYQKQNNDKFMNLLEKLTKTSDSSAIDRCFEL